MKTLTHNSQPPHFCQIIFPLPLPHTLNTSDLHFPTQIFLWIIIIQVIIEYHTNMANIECLLCAP